MPTAIPITEQPFQGETDLTAALTAADATNDMEFDNDGRTLLVVRIGSTATTVTVEGVPDEAGRDGTVSVTATNAEHIFGPFRASWWNRNDGTSKIDVTFDQDAGVQVAALRLTL